MEGSAWQDTPQSLRERDQRHPSPGSTRRRLHVTSSPLLSLYIIQLFNFRFLCNELILYFKIIL